MYEVFETGYILDMNTQSNGDGSIGGGGGRVGLSYNVDTKKITFRCVGEM